MNIRYEVNPTITPADFADLLKRSGLAERRPVDDPDCVAGMVKNANLVVVAWVEGTLAGIARSVTDFHYCCYLSDLAVDREYQRKGIGRELIARTQAELGPHCMIVLLSAPAATAYYAHVGLEKHPQAWVLPRDKTLKLP